MLKAAWPITNRVVGGWSGGGGGGEKHTEGRGREEGGKRERQRDSESETFFTLDSSQNVNDIWTNFCFVLFLSISLSVLLFSCISNILNEEFREEPL